jgi:RHS repeat-associated protein
VKGNNTYSYVKRLEYDKFDQRAFVEAGNGTRTQYAYRADNRRLSALTARTPAGDVFQDLSYTYDPIGNITSRINSAQSPATTSIGGPSAQTYAYDDLSRLVLAEGKFVSATPPHRAQSYETHIGYDAIDNIVSQWRVDRKFDRTARRRRGRGRPGVWRRQPTSFDWRYTYDNVQPHAPDSVGDTRFKYNANGNRTASSSHKGSQAITWDEGNRMQTFGKGKRRATYVYDAAGQRVIKRTSQGATLYVNPYYTVRKGEIGMKDVIVGGTRIASQLVKASSGGTTPVETDIFFYHPDDLGSTNYVTDGSGQLYEHLEYFPSGETWIREAPKNPQVPYLFAGKELDVESGLYYLGARYVDPKLGQFLSPDPQITTAPETGLRDRTHLNGYTYADDNPVRLVDPTGAEPTPSVFSGQYWKNLWTWFQSHEQGVERQQATYDPVYARLYAEEKQNVSLLELMFPTGTTSDSVQERVEARIGPRPRLITTDLLVIAGTAALGAASGMVTGSSFDPFAGLTDAEIQAAVDARATADVMIQAPAPTGARFNTSGGMMMNEYTVPARTSATGATGDVATRIRVHTFDPTAPAGTNSATGNTVNITQGGGARRMTPGGDWYQTSTASEEVMNESHVPIHRDPDQ